MPFPFSSYPHLLKSLAMEERSLETDQKKSHRNSMGVIKAIATHLEALTLIGPVVMLLYPLYASVRAIESPSPLHGQQWLKYWALYSLLTLFELSCSKVLDWLPQWPYMKLVVGVWLALQIFKGAAYIYDKYVRKYVKFGGYVSLRYPKERRKALQMMSLEARKSVERYLDIYGPDALRGWSIRLKEKRRNTRAIVQLMTNGEPFSDSYIHWYSGKHSQKELMHSLIHQ